jgi:hypothetical protein
MSADHHSGKERVMPKDMRPSDLKPKSKPNLARQTIRLVSHDDAVLQYLGAAVILQWHNLPAEIQQTIRQQAECTGGLPFVPRLRQQISALIERSRRYA